jgi:hypothetical protein
MILQSIYEDHGVCVLDPAGLVQSQMSCLRKIYKFRLRKRRNVAIGISKEDCRVNVISCGTE